MAVLSGLAGLAGAALPALGGMAAAAVPAALGALGGGLGQNIGEVVKGEQRAGLSREQQASAEKMSAERAALEKFLQQQRLTTGTEEAEKGREFSREQMTQQLAEAAAGRQRAGALGQQGEQQLLAATAAPSPELARMQQGLRQGTAEELQRATGETRAALSQRGVRGAQAANVLGRTIGGLRAERGRDLSRLAYEDASRRQQQRAGLFGSKALAGAQRAL